MIIWNKILLFNHDIQAKIMLYQTLNAVSDYEAKHTQLQELWIIFIKMFSQYLNCFDTIHAFCKFNITFHLFKKEFPLEEKKGVYYFIEKNFKMDSRIAEK